MSQDQQEKTPSKPRLGEDWLALIIGLGLTLLVWTRIITHVPWPLFGFFK